MTNEAINPDEQFLDNTGAPLSSGTVTFNVNLTPDKGLIYSDEALTIAQENPYTLDAAGRIRGDVRYTGKRRLVVKDRAGAHIRTWDNVATSTPSATEVPYGSTTVGDYLDSQTVADYTALRAGLAAGNYKAGDVVDLTDFGMVGMVDIVAIGSLVDDAGYILTGGSFAARRRLEGGKYLATWWAAVGGVVDQSANLKAARDAVTTQGKGTLLFTDGDYYTTDTVTFDTLLVSLEFEDLARITYDGDKDRSALIIGTSTSSTSSKSFLNLHIVDYDEAVGGSIANPYTDRDYVGVEFIRVKWCDISENYIRGFTTNKRLTGSSASGIAYNKFTLGRSLNSAYHLDFYSTVTTGFINENNFYGGHSTNNSAMSLAIESRGHIYRQSAPTDGGMNANKFYGHAFELSTSNGGVERIPIEFAGNTAANHYYGARAETGRGPAVRCADVNSLNKVEFAFYDPDSGALSPILEEAVGAYGNEATYLWNGVPDRKPEWNSSSIVQRAFGVNASQVAVMGMLTQDSSSADESYSANGEVYADSVSFNSSRGAGVFLDTSFYKQVLVQKTTMRGFAGRWAFVCYDEDDAIISAGTPIWGSVSLTGSSAFGYSYSNGSDNSDRAILTVSSAVKKLKILCVGGTDRIDLASLSVTVMSGDPQAPAISVTSGKVGTQTQLRVNAIPSGAPNGGYSQGGEPYSNYNAASGQPRDWVCTSAGWNAKAWAITTTYRVGQVRENDTGKVYICTVAGTSAGSGGPTGTGSGITDGTVSWNYDGTLPTYSAGANL